MKHHVYHVTDHAVLRYLERVKGVDVEATRREIAARVDKVLQDPRLTDSAMDNATGVVIDGHSYRMESLTIVTVMKANHPDKRTGKVRPERKDPA